MNPLDLDGGALLARLRAREVSCAEVMAACLDRVEVLNPAFNAIVSQRPRETLLAEARAADAAPTRGPLHGLPMAVKDLAATRGIPTTLGSPLFADHLPEADGIMVARLRAAGAIFVGKTNTPEFGLGSHTYNPVFGTTRNAYDPSRTAGGSSGGAAVALALRMLPLADGSDHAGSLRNPAAFNNVFGLRPSFGRVPGSGPDAFTLHLATEGPMARTVADLGLLLAVQAGHDPRAPLSLAEDPAPFAGPILSPDRPARIGWLGDLGGHLPFEPGVLGLCEAATRVFQDLGHAVEPAALGFPPGDVWSAWLALRTLHVRTALAELHSDRAKRALMKPEACWEVERGAALTADALGAASRVRTAWYLAALRLFERYDALALPAAQVFPFPAGETWPRVVGGRAMDTYHRWMEVVIPATMAGLPAMSLPAGFDDRGLPMGLQLIGRPRGELALLRLARAHEEATNWVARRPPPALAA